MASVEVIQYSASDLWRGFALAEPLKIEAGALMYIILGSGTAAKLLLYFYCKGFTESDSVAALAEDHINDVFSNVAAILTASIAAHVRKLWWTDPIGRPWVPQVCKKSACSGALMKPSPVNSSASVVALLRFSNSRSSLCALLCRGLETKWLAN